MIPNFSKGNSPKANIRARLEFELVYYVDEVQHVSHYTTETPPLNIDIDVNLQKTFLYLKGSQMHFRNRNTSSH